MKDKTWDGWSKDDLEAEIMRRMIHFYRKTDGSAEFPNSAEGDLLKMVYILLLE